MVARLIKQYMVSWGFAFSAWPYLLLLWLVNLFFAMIIIGPLNYGLESAFGNSMDLSKLLQGFDYTLIMDFLREYDVVVNAAFDQSLIVIMISLILQIFLTGGIVHIVCSSREEISFKAFWAQCGSYFFRYLGLAILLIVATILMSVLLFAFFSKDGFNPFFLENEMVLINRFWWLLGLFIVFIFWLSIFRDAAKLEIFNNSDKSYLKNILQGLKRSFTLPFLLNGLINALVYLAFIWLFFTIRPGLDLFGWTLILLSQFLLIFRISYRIGRLKSFALV